MKRSLSVLIVDDHPMVAEGIEAILESYDDIEVVATLSSGREIIEQAPDLTPDVILLDLTMPGLSGIETLERLSERIPDVPVIMIDADQTGPVDGGQALMRRVVEAAASVAVPDFFIFVITPKSKRTTRPSSVTKTFGGLISRCK